MLRVVKVGGRFFSSRVDFLLTHLESKPSQGMCESWQLVSFVFPASL